MFSLPARQITLSRWTDRGENRTGGYSDTVKGPCEDPDPCPGVWSYQMTSSDIILILLLIIKANSDPEESI